MKKRQLKKNFKKSLNKIWDSGIHIPISSKCKVSGFDIGRKGKPCPESIMVYESNFMQVI